jgi:uncharacterized membrane protein
VRLGGVEKRVPRKVRQCNIMQSRVVSILFIHLIVAGPFVGVLDNTVLGRFVGSGV